MVRGIRTRVRIYLTLPFVGCKLRFVKQEWEGKNKQTKNKYTKLNNRRRSNRQTRHGDRGLYVHSEAKLKKKLRNKMSCCEFSALRIDANRKMTSHYTHHSSAYITVHTLHKYILTFGYIYSLISWFLAASTASFRCCLLQYIATSWPDLLFSFFSIVSFQRNFVFFVCWMPHYCDHEQWNSAHRKRIHF